MSRPDADYMGIALDEARLGLLAGEPPVGACLVIGERVVRAHNGVVGDLDPTAHAELRVIRAAARELRRLRLDAARLFVTVEPCAMCLAACHYAGIGAIVFGASLADLQAVTGDELGAGSVPAGLALTGGCRRDECTALLADWASRRPVAS